MVERIPPSRRHFLASGLAGVLAPRRGHAQQAQRPRRVAFLSGASEAAARDVVAGFPLGMRELGYVEGRDFVVDWRFAEGRYERFGQFAAELVRANVDAFVLGTTAAVQPVREATASIPIVLGYSVDPVGSGFVASLARPGGNITGLASSVEEIVGKQMELLAAVLPSLSSTGFLYNPRNPVSIPVLAAAEDNARRIGAKLLPQGAGDTAAIDEAFTTLVREKADAIMVTPDALFHSQSARIGALCAQSRLPSIFSQREYLEHGGLMAYGEKLFDFFRRSASFVDRIFRGARPADLPIEQPTRFYLTVNLAAARRLGLTIPETIIQRADEVMP